MTVTLVATEVKYRSALDEDFFFAWLKAIEGVMKVEGVGRDLLIHVDKQRLSDAGLRELLALFYRYDVEMTQLKEFLTRRNAAWLRDNRKAYWHRRMFGDVKTA